MKASYSKRVANLNSTTSIVEVSGMISKSTVTKKIKPVVNHVICIDVSGSMYGVLPKIRTQLKSKLVDIVGDNDTVSLIKFDDRGSIISEMVQISKANDVREMNKLIDKELKDGGCTNFLDPINLADRLASRMKEVKGLWNLFFMSDGGHNTGGSWDEVCAQLQSLQSKISTATICEYGYWADSERLTQMAEILGGQKIFDKDFEEYDADFERLIKNSSTSAVKRVKFDISEFKSSMKYQFMFTVDAIDGSINVYSTEKMNSILIPEDTGFIYFLQKDSDVVNATLNDANMKSAAYAAVYIMASKLKYEVAESILYGLKDKEMIELYSHSYGKQKLEEFKSAILGRAYGITECMDFIKDAKYRPNAKRYCMIDFFNDLTSNESNLIHVTHPDFHYNFTTAKSVNKVELNEDEQKKLSKASTKLKADKILKDAAKHQVKMNLVDPEAGYPVSSLVWNSERADISVLVKIPVNLTVPEESNPSKTFEVKSNILRNYTIIRDGILNQDELIVTLADSALAGKFKRMGLVVGSYPTKGMYRLNLSKVPILNKKYTESVKSYDLAKLEVELMSMRCVNKYLAYLLKGNRADKSSTKKEDYLKSLGISENGIYTPKTELDKTGDFYLATFLETKLEKFSNLPKIEDVLRKKESGKSMTISESYMSKYMDYIDNELKSRSLDELTEEYKNLQRNLINSVSVTKFSLIVSRKWFIDKNGFDDDTSYIHIDGNELRMRFVFSEKRVDL